MTKAPLVLSFYSYSVVVKRNLTRYSFSGTLLS
jgi:hypothetical protein